MKGNLLSGNSTFVAKNVVYRNASGRGSCGKRSRSHTPSTATVADVLLCKHLLALTSQLTKYCIISKSPNHSTTARKIENLLEHTRSLAFSFLTNSADYFPGVVDSRSSSDPVTTAARLFGTFCTSLHYPTNYPDLYQLQESFSFHFTRAQILNWLSLDLFD